MQLNDMRRAIDEANDTLRKADMMAERLAECLVGRLRHVSHYELARLKRELSDFNATTGEWK